MSEVCCDEGGEMSGVMNIAVMSIAVMSVRAVMGVRGGEAEGGGRRRDPRKKQEPHTVMWGKTGINQNQAHKAALVPHWLQ